MTATWTSNAPAFKRDADAAERKALLAAAYVLKNAVKRALRGGYTSGDFVTGLSVNSVTNSEPERDTTGWAIRVGTNLKYNLFWELGHRNAYLRRFVRVEKWRPALMDSREPMRAAYARVWKREMGKWESR